MIVHAHSGHQVAKRMAMDHPHFTHDRHQLEGALHTIKLDGGQTAAKFLHMNRDHHVSKRDVVKVMQGLKKMGLGHHMNTTDASSFVHKQFRAIEEETMSTEKSPHELAVTKRRNLQRAQEAAAEQEAKLKKDTPNKPTPHAIPGAPVQSAWTYHPTNPTTRSKPMVSPDHFHHTTTPTASPHPEDEVMDLGID